MERDLIIVKRLEDNPIIWKVLWGLAEARPALCYCSVILRGALSVHMAHWSATLKASPKIIETTKQILQLLSVGQYLPPPLDSVSDVIEIFHPYQVILLENNAKGLFDQKFLVFFEIEANTYILGKKEIVTEFL